MTEESRQIKVTAFGDTVFLYECMRINECTGAIRFVEIELGDAGRDHEIMSFRIPTDLFNRAIFEWLERRFGTLFAVADWNRRKRDMLGPQGTLDGLGGPLCECGERFADHVHGPQFGCGNFRKA